MSAEVSIQLSIRWQYHDPDGRTLCSGCQETIYSRRAQICLLVEPSGSLISTDIILCQACEQLLKDEAGSDI